MNDVKNYRNANQKITQKPIIYRWWFKQEIVDKLLSKLSSEINKRKILYENGYALLYVGSAVNGNERLLKYHILDSNNFHQTGVENGRLSSLRQTLCGLLECNMSTGCSTVNEFMDRYCKIDWEEVLVKNKRELEEIEKQKIIGYYLPLNWQNTKGILTPKHRRILTQAKKAVKK